MANRPRPNLHGEASRLEALAGYNVLDTPEQPEFNEIVELAAAICGTAIATVTLIDENRQWFKARIGLPMHETPRVIAFCAHAILQSEPLVVPDTLEDRRFRLNPMVTGAPFLRFYTGVPLISAGGYAIGTLAVMDPEPRQLDDTQMLTLKVLSQQVIRQLESARVIDKLNRAVVQRALAEAGLREVQETLEARVLQGARDLEAANAAFTRANQLYRSLWESTYDAVLITDLESQILYANPASQVVFGYPPEQLVGHDLSFLQPQRPHTAHVEGIQLLLAGGEQILDWRCSEIPILKASGEEIVVEVSFSEMRQHERKCYVGFFRDLSAIKRGEAQQRELTGRVEAGQARLAEAQSVAKIGSWEIDLRDASMYWSDETYRIFEVDKEKMVATYDGFLALLHPDDRDTVDERFRASLTKPDTAHELEHRRISPSGRIIYVQHRWKVHCDAENLPLSAIGTVQDITERKAEQDRILRLSRMHEVLSEVNQLIVRAVTPQELFEGCCRIAADAGRFDAAWIDHYDPISRRIHPVARNGLDAGHVVPDERSADPDAVGSLGLAARALVEGRTMLSNDFVHDPGLSSSRMRAVKLGYRSGIAVPLTENGTVTGTLSLLAKEADFFDEGEVELLNELAADISLALDRLANLDRISYLAHYDVLTGLPNRGLFAERLGPVLEEQLRQPHGLGGVVQLDLQRLHEFNDTFGRERGDDLLKLVAQRLSNALGGKSPLGRVAGDHFVFALSGMRDSTDLAHAVQQSLDSCFLAPFRIGDRELHVTARAGVAVFPQDGQEAETLLKNAERALNQAKAEASRLLFYSPEMNAQVAATLLLESRLRTALESGQFVLHYQPKFAGATGAMTGVEGLIRWNDPESGLLPPLDFIHLLEDSGLILEVGKWVLDKAMDDYRRWSTLVPDPPRVAVNVSALQLRQPDFVEVVRRQVELAGVDHGLELEITESVLMTQVEDTIEKLAQLRQMGVRVAIDDFGTGYSSLLYLSKLPLDTLKVDRSFIVRMPHQHSDHAIVSTIVSLAHQLGLNVVAEGVDAAEQVRLLGEMHCDELQGYFFSEPMPAQAIDHMLRTNGAGRRVIGYGPSA